MDEDIKEVALFGDISAINLIDTYTNNVDNVNKGTGMVYRESQRTKLSSTLLQLLLSLVVEPLVAYLYGFSQRVKHIQTTGATMKTPFIFEMFEIIYNISDTQHEQHKKQFI